MRKLLVIAITLLTTSAFAGFTGAGSGSGSPAPQKFRAGLLLGNVALNSVPVKESKNAIGGGVSLGYSVNEELGIELSYIQSKHDDLKYKDYSLGAVYYFESYDPFFFHLTGGVSFTNASDTLASGQEFSDTAFGLFAGIGADIYTKRTMIIGLQTRYYKMFGSDKTVGNTAYTLVDDYWTVMMRVLFQF